MNNSIHIDMKKASLFIGSFIFVVFLSAQPFTPVHTGTIATFGTWTHTNCAQVTDAAPQGACVALFSGAAGSIITPVMDFTTCTATPFVTFKFRRQGSNNGRAQIGIEVSVSGGPWVNIGNIAPTAAGWFIATPINLSAYSGNNNVRLRFIANGGPDGTRHPVIDDIHIYCATPPANDNCATAFPLTVGGPGICTPTAGTVNYGTTSAPASPCGGTANNDVWYSFVATNTQQIIQVTGSPSMDAVIQLLSGTCGSLTSIQCRDATLSGGTETINYTGLTVGTTYYVRVYDWYNSPPVDGSFTICVYENSAVASNCSNPTPIACGATLGAQTNAGRVNNASTWSCHTTAGPPPGAISTDGEDVFYSVTTTTAGFIRITITGASGTGTTYLELLALGNSCTAGTCDRSTQMNLTTGLFTNGLNSWDYDVPAAGTYYFVVDAQGAGSVLNYTIQAQCFASGIRLDNVNNCGAGFGTGDANQGIYTTWNGAQAPANYDASLGGTFTVCENIYLRCPGWEYLKRYEMNVGSCWTNLRNFTPSNNSCFHATYHASCPTLRGWLRTVAGNLITWNFTHPDRFTAPSTCTNVSAWGDGINLAGNYTCALYTFCFTADIDPACTNLHGLQNVISATDDGIGGGGGTQASNITTTYPWAENSSTLPVELVEFKAKCEPNFTLIQWTTASEINNDYFQLERSMNGFAFEPVLQIEGAGNSNGIVKYTVDDNRFEHVVYYRLKQVDFDGTTHFSNIISASCDDQNDFYMSIQNESDQGFINATFSSIPGNSYTVRMVDVHGKTIYTTDIISDGQIVNLSIETNVFSSGIYVIHVSSSLNNHSQKIMIK